MKKVPTTSLSEADKKRLYALAKGSDKSFLANVNRKELDYLLSLVDRQECQSGYYAASYANALDALDKKLV